MLREKHRLGVSILLTRPQVASVKEATCLFLCVLGYWKVSYENMNAPEFLGYLSPVVPLSIHSKDGCRGTRWSSSASMRLLSLELAVRWRSSVPSS